MKVSVVYGGRGLIEDPTLYVLKRMEEVLDELRVEVDRINLYEVKNQITTIPARLKDVDAVILGTSLEWYGVGGYMQQFLDACWLYGDKYKLKEIYMMPVVMATAAGEKEAMLSLVKMWEVLGGIPVEGISSYVENQIDFEMNQDYGRIIEKKTENLYRVVNQQMVNLPSSTVAIRKRVIKPKTIDLTPQESEQLSKIVSDDGYVKKQKEDIEELASLFKNMLKSNSTSKEEVSREREVPTGQSSGTTKEEFDTPKRSGSKNLQTRNMQEMFRSHFHGESDFNADYLFHVMDRNEMLQVSVDVNQLDMSYVDKEEGDVIIRINSSILHKIMTGEMTFQRAFMAGDMTAKGNFKTLRMLDQIFRFS